MKKIKLKRDGLHVNRIYETFSLTNLIEDGMCENNGWSLEPLYISYDSTHVQYGSRALKCVAPANLPEVLIPLTATVQMYTSHVYYARYEEFHEQDLPGDISADIYWPIIAEGALGGYPLGPKNQWNIVSWRFTRSHISGDGLKTFRLDLNNNYHAATVWYDGIMLIDLTAAFGAGNEPTKEWCDKNIEYFNGTMSNAYKHHSLGMYTAKAVNFVEDPSLPVAMRVKADKVIVKQIYEGENADLNLVINNFTIPRLTVNKAMSVIQLSCNQSGVKWFVTLGELPPGLTFTTGGKLSGTPTRPGTFYVLFACQKDEKIVTKGVSIVCGDKICRVTFNAGGGTCSEAYREVVKYTLLGTLPTPKLSGQIFAGWYTAATGGLPVDGQYTVIDDITLYARYGQSSNVQFGDPTTQFKIQYMGDRTNYNNNPYTLYGRRKGASADTTDLTYQTGIQSSDGTNSNNLTNTNRKVTLYLKVTNGGEAGYFDIGFLCDSYINGSDACHLQRITGGVQVGKVIKATVSYANSVWVGRHGQQTANKYVNQAVGTEYGLGTSEANDSGYTFTINDVFINNNSYTILEVTFQVI